MIVTKEEFDDAMRRLVRLTVPFTDKDTELICQYMDQLHAEVRRKDTALRCALMRPELRKRKTDYGPS